MGTNKIMIIQHCKTTNAEKEREARPWPDGRSSRLSCETDSQRLLDFDADLPGSLATRPYNAPVSVTTNKVI